MAFNSLWDMLAFSTLPISQQPCVVRRLLRAVKSFEIYHGSAICFQAKMNSYLIFVYFY